MGSYLQPVYNAMCNAFIYAGTCFSHITRCFFMCVDEHLLQILMYCKVCICMNRYQHQNNLVAEDVKHKLDS